jgi:hypothetical protein
MANTTYNAPNAGVSPTGIKSFKADAALARYSVVMRGVGTPTDEYVTVHTTTTIPLGITLDAISTAEAAAGDLVAVAVLGACNGTLLAVAGAAIRIDYYVCGDGAGGIKEAASTEYFIGRALQAATAAGDIIEITPCPNPVVKA